MRRQTFLTFELIEGEIFKIDESDALRKKWKTQVKIKRITRQWYKTYGFMLFNIQRKLGSCIFGTIFL